MNKWKYAKRLLFAATFVPLALVVLVIALVEVSCEFASRMFDAYEGWCLDYAEQGWTRDYRGYWKKP